MARDAVLGVVGPGVDADAAVPVSPVAPLGRVMVVALSSRRVPTVSAATAASPLVVVRVRPRSPLMSSAYRVLVVVVPPVSTDQVGLSPESV